MSAVMQLKHDALEIANNTLQRAQALEPELREIETRLQQIKAISNAAKLCYQRVHNFQPEIGRDLQCPRC